MKKTIIITSLLVILLLILTPSLSAIQYTTIRETTTTNSIRQTQSTQKKEFKEKLLATTLALPDETKKDIQANTAIQKITTLLNRPCQTLLEKILSILLLSFLIAYLITYTIGGTLGYTIDIIFYILTQGKWELYQATTIALIPSELLFGIMVALYDIGMELFDWPFPDTPGYH
jgi:hypothetical protein